MKRISAFLSLVLVAVTSLVAQIPTDIDVDSGRTDQAIWDNPWYLVLFIAIILIAALLIRRSRKN